jgi:hypothetical protein
MQFGNAHPWLLLFGVKGGLFYHSPVCYLSLAGFVVLLRRFRTMPVWLLTLLAVSVLQVFVYSANLGWHSYGTFGARKLTSLAAVFTLTAAVAVAVVREWAARAVWRRQLLVAMFILGPLALTFGGASYGMRRGKISTDVSLSQTEFFGDGARFGWSLLENQFGPVTVLPAAWIFSLRYGLPPSAYRSATDPTLWYQRKFRSRSFSFTKDSVDFRSTHLKRTTLGGDWTKKGWVLQAEEEASFVFCAEWPFATHLKFQAAGETSGCVLHVAAGRLFGNVDFEAVKFDDKGRALVAIADGGFSGGINEFEVWVEGCSALNLQQMGIEDRNEYLKPFDQRILWSVRHKQKKR